MADFYILWIYLMVSCIVGSLSFFIHIILKFKRQSPPNFRSHLSHVFLQRNGEYRSNLIVEILFLVLCLIFSWYAISIGFTIFNKWLLNEFRGGFRYPLITTTIHMFMKYIVSRLYYRHYYGMPPSSSSSSHSSSTSSLSSQSINNNNTNNNNNNNPVDNFNSRASSALVFVVILIGVCTSADVALSNESILLINVTLYTTLKATVVIFTFCWAILFQIETFRWPTALAITCVFIGVGIALLSTAQFSIFGVTLALLASCIAGLRWTLLQYLLLSDPLSASNSLIALYRFSLYAFISILPIAMYVEGYSLIQSIFFNHPLFLLEALALSLLGGILSLFLIVTEVQLVQLTSSLTLGVAGNIKEIIQIGLAMMVYKDQMNARTISGIILTLIAAQYYSYLQNKYKVKDYPQYYYWYANQYSVSQTLNPQGSRYDQCSKISNSSPSGSRSGTAGGNGVVKHRRKRKHRLPHRLRKGGKVFVNTLESIQEHPSETSSIYDNSPINSPFRPSNSNNYHAKRRFSTVSNTSNHSSNKSNKSNNNDKNTLFNTANNSSNNSINTSFESSSSHDNLLSSLSYDQQCIESNDSSSSNHGSRLLFGGNSNNNNNNSIGVIAGHISPIRINNTSLSTTSPYKRSSSLIDSFSLSGSGSSSVSHSSSNTVNNPLRRLSNCDRDDDYDDEEAVYSSDEVVDDDDDDDDDDEYASGSDDDSDDSYEEDEQQDFEEELQGSGGIGTSGSSDGSMIRNSCNHHHGLTVNTSSDERNGNNEHSIEMHRIANDTNNNSSNNDDHGDDDNGDDQTQYLLPMAMKKNSSNNNNNNANGNNNSNIATVISPRVLLGAGGNSSPRMIPLLRSFSDDSYDSRKGIGNNNNNDSSSNSTMSHSNSTSDVFAAMLMSPSRATAVAGLSSLALMVGLTTSSGNNNSSAPSSARHDTSSNISIPNLRRSSSNNNCSSGSSSSSSSSSNSNNTNNNRSRPTSGRLNVCDSDCHNRAEANNNNNSINIETVTSELLTLKSEDS